MAWIRIRFSSGSTNLDPDLHQNEMDLKQRLQLFCTKISKFKPGYHFMTHMIYKLREHISCISET